MFQAVGDVSTDFGFSVWQRGPLVTDIKIVPFRASKRSMAQCHNLPRLDTPDDAT